MPDHPSWDEFVKRDFGKLDDFLESTLTREIESLKGLKMKKMYVVYLINDNFGFDGIVGVFNSVQLAQKAAEEFDDGFSVPTIYETVVNTQREYL